MRGRYPAGMKRLAAAALIASALVLSACTGQQPEAPEESSSPSAEPTLRAEDIATAADGKRWAEALTEGATASEIATGIDMLVPLVHDSGADVMAANRINQDLLSLKIDVLNAPDDSGPHVDALREIVGRLP